MKKHMLIEWTIFKINLLIKKQVIYRKTPNYVIFNIKRLYLNIESRDKVKKSAAGCYSSNNLCRKSQPLLFLEGLLLYLLQFFFSCFWIPKWSILCLYNGYGFSSVGFTSPCFHRTEYYLHFINTFFLFN